MAHAGGDTFIDGSILEGGGQILRNSVSVAAILKKPITISNIRGGRKDPGLKPQHLTGLQLVDAMCGGRGLSNAAKGSMSISFRPERIKGGRYTGDTRTAGSICLLAQVVVPVALFADFPSEFVLRGGTDVDFAPTIDYFIEVFLPFARRFGVEMEVSVIRRGFFPKGGGEVRMNVKPLRQLRPVEFLATGNLKSIRGRVFIINLNQEVARHICSSATAALRSTKVPVNIEFVQEQGPHNTRVAGITLIAENETGLPMGVSTYSRRGVPPEAIGEEAAAALMADFRSGGCVGEHMSDQLILLMALASGQSRIRTGPLTKHAETSIHICQELLGAKFDVKVTNEGRDDVSTEISCTGIGFVNDQVTAE